MVSHRSHYAVLVALVLMLAMLACHAPGPTATPLIPPTQLPPSAAALATRPGSELVTPANLTAVTRVETNIRTGPGTDHAILGTLAAGLSVRLTGRNADTAWFQIEFPSGPQGRAWVFADNVTLTAGVDPSSLPVVNIPPAPTRTAAATIAPTMAATPKTPTATRKPPTATPKPTTPPVFRADKTQLTAGECTMLRWDVENVKAVFLDVGRGEEPVTGHDTRQVCLDVTTTFTLRVVKNDDTSQQYTVTITVSGQCGNTPVVARFEAGATHIKPGQNVTILWDVLCAQAIFFKEGDGALQPVTGHDQRQVNPSLTTVYHLIVIARDGSEFRYDLTITVQP